MSFFDETQQTPSRTRRPPPRRGRPTDRQTLLFRRVLAGGIAFVVIFPITFIASTFVPTSTLPGVLKTIAEWNPTSALANSLRHQFGNPGGAIPHDAIFPLAHPFAYTLIWAVAIVLVCAPLSVVLYQRSIKS